MANEIISQQQFIDYLADLAPEGETLLLTKQKPVKIDGEQAAYGDGNLKYTWPAFLPNKFNPKGASYANTGSFIIDRLGARASASAANCEFVLVMVLDDIGTKSKIPPIEPTWKMETSPNNFQWGYTFALDDMPTKGDFCAAIKAIALAGYTDGGAINAVRNFRLPGSVNLKPGRDGFASRLIEFNSEREFSLTQILNALDVTPDEANTSSFISLKLDAPAQDDVIDWLADNGFILEAVNQSGWWGVVCPNYSQHSDGNVMGRYHSLNRAYVCYHEHCSHINSTEYLDAIAAEGAPAYSYGLQQEVLANAMRGAIEKVLGNTPPESSMLQEAVGALKEVVRKELNRVEKSEWFDRFMYVQNEDAFFDVHERLLLSRATFNAVFRAVPCRSIDGGRRIEASIAFDEMRSASGSQTLLGLTYAAGDGVVVGRMGSSYVHGNRWQDARPDVSDAPSGDISLWSNLVKRLVPDDDERSHILDIMAFKLKNPRIKINHAVLHIGDEGCGKDSIWAPFIWAVCGDNLLNRGYMDSDSINESWGYALESEILIINELKEPNAADRRALANKLKPIIAAPPEMLPIKRKGLHPYDMANRLFVLAYSNEDIAISLADQDRRWFVISSRAPRMVDDEGLRLWTWYKSGGFAMIAKHLYERDVSAFNPGATPMLTDAKRMMIENGRSASESFLVDAIRNNQGEFSRGFIASPFHLLCDRLTSIAPQNMRVSKAALLHALREARWADLGLVSAAGLPNKKHMFASEDTLAVYSKSDLRRMVDEPIVAKSVVLNMVKG
jgi:hypothetical protein